MASATWVSWGWRWLTSMAGRLVWGFSIGKSGLPYSMVAAFQERAFKENQVAVVLTFINLALGVLWCHFSWSHKSTLIQRVGSRFHLLIGGI